MLSLEGKVRFGDVKEGGRRTFPNARRPQHANLLEATLRAVSSRAGIGI